MLGRGTCFHEVVVQGRVDGWIRLVHSVEECGAVGPPEGVRAGERHHVGGVELSGGESVCPVREDVPGRFMLKVRPSFLPSGTGNLGPLTTQSKKINKKL